MLYNIIIPKPSISFCMTYDHMTITGVISHHNPNLKFKIRK